MLNNDLKAPSKLFNDCTPLLLTPDKMRETAARQGYLFFKGLLNKDQVTAVRMSVLEILERWGLLDLQYPLEDGVADEEAVNRLSPDSFEGLGVPWQLYREVQKLESFHLLAHQPSLLYALTVTEHRGGAGGLESILCGLDLEWVQGDYEAGDVILFHSHTVHKALPNKLGNVVRLSCDFRYQPIDQPIDPSSLKPHGHDGLYTWNDLYENWICEELRFYWERTMLDHSEWDESLHWQKEKIC